MDHRRRDIYWRFGNLVIWVFGILFVISCIR
jgi:hypothetical protein